MGTPEPQTAGKWKVRGERTIYESKWVRLGLVDVKPPGVERFDHHVVHLKRAAITAVVDESNRVLMLWRYRFVADQWGWELPGGLVEPDEDPAAAAAREVEEETGWRPGDLRHVLTYEPIAGMVDSPHDIFVASGATKVGDPSDPEESGHVAWVPLSDIPTLLAAGELLGSGTLVALLHVLAFGNATPQP